MKEIKLWKTGVSDFQLSQHKHFTDSNGNIVGFHGLSLQNYDRIHESLDHEELYTHHTRPAFEFKAAELGDPALGTIRVLGSGRKYLHFKGKKPRCRQPRLIYQDISPIDTDVVNSKR
jgi:hypothetical protein